MPNTSEETPLLSGSSTSGNRAHDHDTALKHEELYNRFTKTHKRVILALISLSGLLPLFANGSFIPSIPQIALELHSSGTVISLAVSLALFFTAIGNLSWATYSEYYGRRLMYLSGLPMLCMGSLGVAMAKTVPDLIFWRLVQAFGCSGGLSLGAGVIGDIYKIEERGTAMGIFFGAVLLGPALAPLAGGLAAHYLSWRLMQYILSGWGLTAFILMYFLLPETSHPGTREVDKAIASSGAHPGFVWLNPLQSLWLLRSPNLMAITIATTGVLLTDYVMLIPIAYTIGVRYNITNEAIIGACFLPIGLGNLTGAPVAGWISDRMVIKWRERRGGKWVPEDRLRGTTFAAAVLVPVSVLLVGLIIQFVDGKFGLYIVLVLFFVNGFGLDLVLVPASAYGADILHSRSAEVMAANNGLRAMILSIATTAILPLINTIGVAGTNAISAFLAWVAFGLIWATMRYGDRMRAWVDVGYSTAENN